jgi:hypothetical protein
LVHFLPSGHVVEICGDKVELLYKASIRDDRFPLRSANRGRYGKVAFVGLARQGGNLWAAGIDGIHVIGPSGVSRTIPLPNFRDFGGVRISFDMPELILVLTDVNQRHSVSGPVPILVPR